MITEINLKNYKAFEDVTIPFKPITIFLGANSVGNSNNSMSRKYLKPDTIVSFILGVIASIVANSIYENFIK